MKKIISNLVLCFLIMGITFSCQDEENLPNTNPEEEVSDDTDTDDTTDIEDNPDNDTDTTTETENTYDELDLIGRWDLISEEEVGNDIFNIVECNDKYIMILSKKEDGSNLAQFEQYTMMDQECTASTSWDYVWEITDDQFVTYTTTDFDDRYDEDTYTIIELSSTTLKRISTTTYTENGVEKTSEYIDTFKKL